MRMPKFELGQKVYAVTSVYSNKEQHVTCDVCNSTGMVEIKGQEYNCPSCHGKMETVHLGFKYVISHEKAEIGKINMELYSKRYERQYKSEVRYMLRETGVGSGSLWREERLFATKAEAQEFCDKYAPASWYDSEEPVLKSKVDLKGVF